MPLGKVVTLPAPKLIGITLIWLPYSILQCERFWVHEERAVG